MRCEIFWVWKLLHMRALHFIFIEPMYNRISKNLTSFEKFKNNTHFALFLAFYDFLSENYCACAATLNFHLTNRNKLLTATPFRNFKNFKNSYFNQPMKKVFKGTPLWKVSDIYVQYRY